MKASDRLAALDGIMWHDKASIMLVHGGLKPSALVIVEGRPFKDSDAPIKIEAEYINLLSAVLKELQLTFMATTEIMSSAISGQSQEVMRLFIACDSSTALRLKNAFDDIGNNHAEAGMLLGYPETAVNAFLTPNMLEQQDTPLSTDEVSELNMRLLGHRLSKDNWRNEIKYLESWGNYLKNECPKIYAEVTKADPANL